MPARQTRQAPDRKGRTPRQARARATVDVILMAAAHILTAEGPARLSTNRVAGRAGVSVGSLYQYFRNKQELLDSLRERYTSWMEQAIDERVANKEVLPLREAVRSSVERLVAMHRLDPALHAQFSGDGHPHAPEKERDYRARIQTYLEEHGASLRPMDAALASYIISRVTAALLHGTAQDAPEWLEHPHFADEVTELLVRYLAR